ncbi:hypothetical protein [Microbacterium arborescens]|uniref:hypothetical protein n=1 Tax=Microbacterium arborescens TaxID=33883 RepID=UPI0027D84100|nr:hypothetical protein [Microbacterium arborescens]
MTELVGVDAVPDLPADGAALVAAADTLAASGPLVGDRLDDVGATWHRVPMVYDAPETQTAATAVLPVLRVGEDFSDAARSASAALRELGESLIPLERTRSALLADIEAHRAQVLAYRASDAAAAEDPADPLAGWGPTVTARTPNSCCGAAVCGRCSRMRSTAAARASAASATARS